MPVSELIVNGVYSLHCSANDYAGKAQFQRTFDDSVVFLDLELDREFSVSIADFENYFTAEWVA